MAQGESFPPWVKELAGKVLPWMIMGMIAGGVTLYTDNIENKRDISRNTWRNDQQDARLDKGDARADRTDAAISSIQDSQSEFHREAIHRLDKLVAEKERRGR